MDYLTSIVSSGGDTMKAKRKAWQGIEVMSKKKMERRRELAKLSFEEKISILKLLQGIANQIVTLPGRKCRRVWP